MKRYQLKVTSKSKNLISELNSYKWQEDKNGYLINKPIDSNNHAIDAIRYAVMMSKARPNIGKYAIK